MEKEKGYNGWTNYETWNVKLWMDNDEGTYNYNRERTKEVYDRAEPNETFTKAQRAAFDLMDILKEEFEENAPTSDSGPYADLLNAAMSEINWYEIATSLIEDAIADEAVQ